MLKSEFGRQRRMKSSDECERWTWNSAEHPGISHVFSSAKSTSQWYDDLEKSASDAVTGKVLCVVAGLAIARAVIETEFPDHERLAESISLLDLADAWIDDPSDDRFDKIAEFLFDEGREWPVADDPLKVVWGALRIATSSVGDYEAGWALGRVVDDATKANLDGAEIARRAVQCRSAQS